LDAPTLTELQGFTLGSYIRLLEFLREHYKIVPFYRANYQDTPYLILRHDIDFSLREALEMARTENKLNIKSTYFVLLSSVFYNIFEGENASYLKQISNLGHEIGLHYHPAQYERYDQNPQSTLLMQVRLVESLTGKKIYSISRHGLWARDPFATSKEFINANNPYFRGDLFVHESSRAWTTVNGLSLILRNGAKRVQLLIHPENWQTKSLSREKLLEKHFQELSNRIKYLKIDLLDHYKKDPLILNYEQAIENIIPDYLPENRIVSPESELNWRRLSSYYFTHSRIGWKLQQLLLRIKEVKS
jgi:hypothetical protein